MADQTNPNGQSDPTRTYQYWAGERVGWLLGLNLGAISGLLVGTGITYVITSLSEVILDISVDKWAIALGAGMVFAITGAYLLSKALGKALGIGLVASSLPLIGLR